jgi:radical SAM superfamily enzyme YgiQ (UPF0313 family)
MDVTNPVDFAFLFPPGGEINYFSRHLGVAYIQAALAAHGISSKQVVPPMGSTLAECVNHILAVKAPLVGFTCFDGNYHLIRTLASFLKKQRPETLIIAGGPSATFSDELILNKTPDIDVCVRYEGEETALELARLVLGGGSLDNLDKVKGISFRRDGSIIRTADRPLFGSASQEGGELDDLLSPYLTGVLQGTEGTGILTARGCTHQCTFCNFSAMSRHRIRYHSIDRVIAELKTIQAAMEAKPPDIPLWRVVTIHDDAFTLNVPRAKEICRRIISERISLQLSCLCRADNLDEELIELLKQAGFLEITFGLESAVPRVLRNIKKVSTQKPLPSGEAYAPEERFLSQVKAGIAMAKRHNMRTSLSIVLGLPGESLEDGLQTIDFVHSLNVDSYAQNLLVAFPGTEVFDTAGDYGIEILPSESVLPYYTKHAYTTSSVPYYANSSFHRQARTAAQTILRAFAGDSTQGRVSKGIALAIIKAGAHPDLGRFFRWLARYLAVGGKVFIIGNGDINHDDFMRMLELNFSSGMPTRDCYYLGGYEAENADIVYKPSYNRVFHSEYQFPEIGLGKYLQYIEKSTDTNTGDRPIIALKEETDVNVLSAMADCLKEDNENSIDNAAPWFDAVFMDGCRWNTVTCPALNLKRVVINQNGEVCPCLSGQPLGTCNDDIDILRERAQKKYQELINQRGCSNCPADSRCAKCLFPHPMSVSDYCEIQRAHPEIAGIVLKARLANTFTVSNDMS